MNGNRVGMREGGGDCGYGKNHHGITAGRSGVGRGTMGWARGAMMIDIIPLHRDEAIERWQHGNLRAGSRAASDC